MAAAVTTTGSLADSKQLIIDSARNVREYKGVYKRTTDLQRLEPNTGMSWEEVDLAQLSATTVSETTEFDNPQEITDTIRTLTPTMVGIEVIVTDLVYRRLAKKTIAKIGPLAQNAIERKNDEDYLDLFSTFSNSVAGTGTTLSHGHLAAAKANIVSNVTEGAVGDIFAVLHGFQIKDLADEIRAGVGTYTIPKGFTEDVYRQGFVGMTLDGINIFEDGNITIDSTPDARGAIHAREGVIYVQGKGAWTETERKQIGGGADAMFYYDEKAVGVRTTLWQYSCLTDATAPTS